MRKTLYLVRHCQSEGQAPDAPLTPVGQVQAEALADFLLSLSPVQRIVASPFLRAQQSAAPLARQLGLAVEIDGRLAERTLWVGSRPDWLERIEASFADPALCYPGGESGETAQGRGVAALQDILRHPANCTVAVTHGNLLALLLNHFDQRVGFSEYRRLTNPDVFRVSVSEAGAAVERVWRQH